jgi:head-tail adaptor
MNIADAVSSLTGGFWSGFATTSTGSSVIRGANATLMLSKLTITQSDSMSPIETWTDVQSLRGSLQPTTAKEREVYSKETMVANFKFYVLSAEFTSDANRSEVKGTSKMTNSTPAQTFNIVGFDDRTYQVPGQYMLVFLEEVT